MREKIVFFILGALLATIAYSAGSAGRISAQDFHFGITRFDEIECNKLRVLDPTHRSGMIQLGFHDEKGPTMHLMSSNKKSGGVFTVSASDNGLYLIMSANTIGEKTILKELTSGTLIVVDSNGTAISVEGESTRISR